MNLDLNHFIQQLHADADRGLIFEGRLTVLPVTELNYLGFIHCRIKVGYQRNDSNWVYSDQYLGTITPNEELKLGDAVDVLRLVGQRIKLAAIALGLQIEKGVPEPAKRVLKAGEA